MTTRIQSGTRIFTLVALACLLGACRRQPDTLDEVIARNTAAAGGRSAIEGIQSIEILLHITDPGFEVDATYRAMRPGWMRIDVMAGGEHVYTEAFDGNRGWQWKGKGDVVPEGPEATAALRHGVELPGKLFGLHELRERGHQLTLAARELISGTNYYVLQTKLSDGYTTSLYIDPNSWLVTRRRDVRPLHVDVDPRPTTIETVFSDFRRIGGVQFPFVSADTDLQTGKVLEKVRVNRMTLNPAFVTSLFQQL
jgi:hypothetical protein